KLLANRGLVDKEEIERFLYPSFERDFHDPFLMKDMAKAVARIGEAIEKKERIMIFGDYDVDGITASAILMRALTKLGAAVSYRLPHRIDDGYGLREKFIKEFAKLEVKVAITVDNGISSAVEVEMANELGIDVIITDHHTIPEKIPNAFAILHPKLPGAGYPFAELTGAGVALKLASALLKTRTKDHDSEIKKLFDLACMGTIADIGSLRGENRYIVKEGLSVLEHTRWPGLSRLKESAGIKGKVNVHAIGFLLGPRINAAGRISHPSDALKLLLQNEAHSEILAQQLEKLNTRRQQMMVELMGIAYNMAEKQAADPVIIISHKDFHAGIIGLIAAKLSEKYFRPAIVMEERNEVFVGSCRSIPQINILEIITTGKEFLSHFGGHAAAAGFDLPKSNAAKFIKKVKTQAKSFIKPGEAKQVLLVECELKHDEISKKTIETIGLFEPFGHDNEAPLFICRGLPVADFGTVGKEKNHLKVKFKIDSGLVDCIGFRLAEHLNTVKRAKKIDVVCEIEANTWNGRTTVQLKIIDFKPVAMKQVENVEDEEEGVESY
ncbi:MAG: single-stranded-DNA-specific exonuclease RecJ, partial [Candidatus Gracilibacteria bacterium]